MYVIDGLAIGGAEKQLLILANELCQLGHDVLVYVLKKNGPRLTEFRNSCFELILDEKGFGINFPLMYRLRKNIKEWRPDIIHGYLFHGNLNSRASAIGLNVPVFNSERNDNYRLSAGKQLIHNITKHLATAVIANSHAGRDFSKLMFGLPDDKVHVVWNGQDLEYLDKLVDSTDADYRTEFFKTKDVRIAVLVGSINQQKDHLFAIDVAKALISKDERWRILFVGDTRTYAKDDYKDRVMDSYEQSGIRDKILFTGNRSDVPEIVSQCDILFMTSRHEGFPNAVLEAMCVGTAVVSTDFSDIRLILPCDWQVVKNTSAEAMAEKILYAYENREQTALAQRRWVENNATRQRLAAKHLDLYRKYINSGS